MLDVENLVQRIQALPPERIAEIEDFVAFVTAREHERGLVQVAAAASEVSFARVWDNPDDAAYDHI